MTEPEPGAGTGGDPSTEAEVGSVAEEAARLFGALQDWANESGFGAQGEATASAGVAEGLRAAGEHLGHGPDCRYCPVCRAINLVRQTSPEVRESLAVAIGALAQAATASLRQDHDGRDAGTSDSSGPTRVDLDD